MSKINSCISHIEGKGIPILGNDIDTDRIIPARFMKSITFEGIGQYAFYDVRFDSAKNELSHPFNDKKFNGNDILLVNKNFGCGSSREHAPQALQKFGIRAIIGESFAEIFAGNCTAMGIPAVIISANEIEELQKIVDSNPDYKIVIDLINQTISIHNKLYKFSMSSAYLKSLIQGTWDSTAVLLENNNEIIKTANQLPYVSGY